MNIVRQNQFPPESYKSIPRAQTNHVEKKEKKPKKKTERRNGLSLGMLFFPFVSASFSELVWLNFKKKPKKAQAG